MGGKQFLTLKPFVTNYDVMDFNHTKVLGLKCYYEDKLLVTRKQPTTWASLLREVIHTFEYGINTEVDYNPDRFESNFNMHLGNILTGSNARPNISFSEKLFTEPTQIKSSLYAKSKNSKVKIFTNPNTGEDRNITAVFSGEVIWVIHALLNSLSDYGAWVEIEYIRRADCFFGDLACDGQLSIDRIIKSDQEIREEFDTDLIELEGKAIRNFNRRTSGLLEDDPVVRKFCEQCESMVEDSTSFDGNAEMYIAQLKLKISELFQEDKISQKEYDQMASYIDKVFIVLTEVKSVISLMSKFSNDLSSKLGI